MKDRKKKAKKNIKNFTDGYKSFITKGNIIDLAVGVVIGSAFTAIVNSLVSNIITPLISILTKNEQINGLKVIIEGVEITYGVFLESVINFFIISFVIYFVVFYVIRRRKTLADFEKQEQEELKKEEEAKKLLEEEAKALEVPESMEVVLLKEIKELLERRIDDEKKN